MFGFASEKDVQIDLEDQWIKVKASVTFAVFKEFMDNMGEDGKATLSAVVPLLKKVITSWSFLGDSGEPVPVSDQAVDSLTYETVMALFPKVMDLYSPKKKDSTTLVESSSAISESQK